MAGIDIWNPAFDVTPSELITGGVVTELGVFQMPLDSDKNMDKFKKAEEEEQLKVESNFGKLRKETFTMYPL